MRYYTADLRAGGEHEAVVARWPLVLLKWASMLLPTIFRK